MYEILDKLNEKYLIGCLGERFVHGLKHLTCSLKTTTANPSSPFMWCRVDKATRHLPKPIMTINVTFE